MGYRFAMNPKILFVSAGMAFMFITASWLGADQVEMQNGDRYLGKVLSLTGDTVVVESEVLGRINVPRKKVAALVFGTNTSAAATAANVARVSAHPAKPPSAAALVALANTNADLPAALRSPATNLASIRQIRDQMLAGSPAAAGKYDEIIGGLMSGKLDLNDLRREAKLSADQLRELKRDLGPDAGVSLDLYLGVLDDFLKGSAAAPPIAMPVAPQKTQAR